MSQNNNFLDTDEIIFEHIPHQVDADSSGILMGNALAKVAVGAVIGATLGAIAGALADKITVMRVNIAVKSLGIVAKIAAEGVNQTVKDVENGLKSVAENVNESVKDVGDSFKVSSDRDIKDL